MSISPENAPKLPQISLVGGAFATGAMYAFLLSTKQGRKFDQQHNWFVVMIGVFFTLGWLAIHDPRAAGRAFVFFVATGLPIIARSLLLDSEEKDAITNRSAK